MQGSGSISFGEAIHAITVISNIGLIAALLKFFKQWNQVVERSDMMFKTYCEEHDIPFLPIGRK